ncbi:MAG: hypothetical protein LBE72_01705 [Rickettsia sp.]|nr:hypothetical protein [Rickettsia sp.]
MADAHAINELQGKLQALVNLHKEGEGIYGINIDLVKHQVEESISSGKIGEMNEVSKYLDELINKPVAEEGSVELSKLLLDLSSILPVDPVAVNNGGNIDSDHTTHSSIILAGDCNIEAEGFI